MIKDFTNKEAAGQLYFDLFVFVNDFRQIMKDENNEKLTDELVDMYAKVGAMCQIVADEVAEQMATHPKAQMHGIPIDTV